MFLSENVSVTHTLSGDRLTNQQLGDVQIEFSDEQCMNFQQRQWTERKKGRREEFWRVEYEVTFVLRGMIMEYELAIPKTGIWPPDGADRYGPGLIRGTGVF